MIYRFSDLTLIFQNSHSYIYRFSDLTLIDHIETCMNSKGLCSLSGCQDRTVLACPSVQKGKVLVVFLDQQKIQAAQSGMNNQSRRLVPVFLF